MHPREKYTAIKKIKNKASSATKKYTLTTRGDSRNKMKMLEAPKQTRES
jgi:hypothetical protein